MPLPGGNGLLTHAAWQPLPGLPGATLWPYLRKVDTVSSNSYIFESGDLVIVIDPGGLAGQADELAAAVRSRAGSTGRPALALLTHAHIDHCKVLMDHPFFRDQKHVLPAVQETGARALATADTRLTQAALLGQKTMPVKAALRLFPSPDTGREVSLPLGTGGPTVRLSTAYQRSPDGTIQVCQKIRTDESCTVRLYHTPGHSPDSICVQAGPLLFIGDLLFAASPGIAGMYGWDRPALIRSVDEVLSLLKGGTITHCCPGHGRILTCSEAMRVLAGVKKDAAGLEGIDELSPAWAKETALYAEGLMDEAGEIFTIIAARLNFVAYVLDELEESGEAGEVARLIDADRIDALLEDFHQFLAEYRAGSRMDVHLALKAGQVVTKLEQVFVQERLELVLDPDYLRRLQRLLNDYITVLRGFRPPRMLQPVAVGELVSGLVNRLNPGSTADEDLIRSADDPAAFTRALVRRIGRITVFDGVACRCPDDISPATADADPVLLGDVVRTLLEDIAGTGSRGIVVRVSAGDQSLSVSLDVVEPGRMPDFRDIRKRFLASECARSGGEIAWPQGAGPQSVRIDLPLTARPVH